MSLPGEQVVAPISYEEETYYCPFCGREIYEDVFLDKQSGLILGCDQCIEIKKKEDVLDAE